MAESQAVAKQVLTEKLEDQLTCAICLDTFCDPKLLPCFHVFCKDCLERLVVKDRQGQLSLSCPTCRKSVFLPPVTGVSGLQSAFHIHHLFEIQDAVEKLKPQPGTVKVPQNVLCEKCTKTTRKAANYCYDCGKYICEICTNMHVEWDEFSAHKLVSIEELCSQVTQVEKVVTMPKEGALYCSQHKGKELDLYCETCDELICIHCTISKHCKPKHKYEPVDDIVKQHKDEITESLAPIEKQVSTTSKTLDHISTQKKELNDQKKDCEARIQQEIKRIQEMLETRKTELLSQLDRQIQRQTKELLKQKDRVEMAQAELISCLTFVEDSMKVKSHRELMQTKKVLLKRIKRATHQFDMDELLPPPRDFPTVKFVAASNELALACQQFGEVCCDQERALLSPKKCHAIGKGLEVAGLGEKTIAMLHFSGVNNEALISTEIPVCKIVSESTGERASCAVTKLDLDQYEVSYKLIHRGRYNLHIKVCGEHIKGSPFPVIGFKRLSTPAIKFIGQGYVKWPWGIAFNQNGDIVVAEGADCCVSLFKPSGVKFLSFGTQGTGEGKFKLPRCVAVDNDGNILVTDKCNCNLQKFTSEGKFITSVMGKTSRDEFEFVKPRGITVHPQNNRVYVVDNHNHHVIVLQPDLTFFSKFGSQGSGYGQFNQPYGITIDSSRDEIYIADKENHRIQVFTAEGKFLRQFGMKGRDNGKLLVPMGITIDNTGLVYVTERGNHRISVFTSEGTFLTSFGGVKGSRPEQLNRPRGIAVDDSGMVYVCDTENNRLILL